MQEAGPWPGSAEERKDRSEVWEGELSGQAPMVGVGIEESARQASVWEVRTGRLCPLKATPKPLTPELQPLLEQEGTVRDWGGKQVPSEVSYPTPLV